MPVPAFAGYTVKMGARVNQEIGWSFTSKERTVNGKDDVTDSFVNLVGNSYLRAKFMSDDKKVGAMIEIGMKEGSNIGNPPRLRLVPPGPLHLPGRPDRQLAGRQGPLLGPRRSCPKDPAAATCWAGARPGFPASPRSSGPGTTGRLVFQAALEKTRTMPADGMDTSGSDVHSMWPSVSLGFDYTSKSFEVTPAFIWSQWQIEGAPTGYDDVVYSYGLIVPLAVKVGGFKLILEGHYAQNPSGLYSTWGGSVAQFKSDGQAGKHQELRRIRRSLLHDRSPCASRSAAVSRFTPTTPGKASTAGRTTTIRVTWAGLPCHTRPTNT